MPVSPADDLDASPSLRIGNLGCQQLYTVELFESRVEMEVKVTLADGSERAVKMPSKITVTKKPKQGKRVFR